MTFDEILAAAVAVGANDVLVGGNEYLRLRVNGRFQRCSEEILDAPGVDRMLYGIMQPFQIERLEEEKTVDLSLDGAVPGFRFRVNIYYRRGGLAAVARPIPLRIPTLSDLGVPTDVVALLEKSAGLIIVAGRVGSGKSTLCASFLQHLNETRECHIVTLEDPIEYVFEPKKAVICQREMRLHAHGFQDALKSVLRQSPDVIYVGEVRDLPTIAHTLAAAETGHLVIANLHTATAPQTVSRIVDVFPPDQRLLIAVQLSNVLTGVVCQVLLPRASEPGLVAVREIMLNNTAISHIIRKSEHHLLYSTMESSFNIGMRTMDRSLAELYVKGDIAMELAHGMAVDQDGLKRQVDGLLEDERRRRTTKVRA